MDIRSAGGPVLAAGVGAARHVGDERADVGVGPEGPAQGHVGAGSSGGVERGGGGTGIALHVDRCGVLDGAVAGDGAGDSGGLIPSISYLGARGEKVTWSELPCCCPCTGPCRARCV